MSMVHHDASCVTWPRDDPRRRFAGLGLAGGDRVARRVDGQERSASDVGYPVDVAGARVSEFLSDAE